MARTGKQIAAGVLEKRRKGRKAVEPELDRTPTIVEPPNAALRWREFREFDGNAVAWIVEGHVAVTPGPVERISGGVSLYIHTRDPATFATAARMIGTDPRSVPAGRTGSNVDGEFLLRAIVLCRRERLGEAPTAEATRLAIPYPAPWLTRCPTCGGWFHQVAEHTLALTGELTSVSCANGHRWRV